MCTFSVAPSGVWKFKNSIENVTKQHLKQVIDAEGQPKPTFLVFQVIWQIWNGFIKLRPGNTSWRGKLSTIDLLSKLARLAFKAKKSY